VVASGAQVVTSGAHAGKSGTNHENSGIYVVKPVTNVTKIRIKLAKSGTGV
jgi:hypothetical protein